MKRTLIAFLIGACMIPLGAQVAPGPITRALGTVSQPLLFAPDNTYDVGASASGRPRNVYVAGLTSALGGLNMNASTINLDNTGSSNYTLNYNGLSLSAPGEISMLGRARYKSPADGIAQLTNQASTGFTRLILGTNDATSNGVSIVTSTGNARIRTGDGTVDTGLIAAQFIASAYFGGPGTVATAGDLRLKSQSAINFRNASNTADLLLIGENASDQVVLDSAANGLVIANGKLQTGGSGTVTTYNNTLTAGNGLSYIVGTTGLLSAQGANIGTTNLVASAAAGLYEVCGWAVTTRVATTSSTLPSTSIAWNNGVSALTYTLTPTNAGNTTNNFQLACIPIRSAAAQAISYSTAGYVTSGATSMQYELYVTVRAIY